MKREKLVKYRKCKKWSQRKVVEELSINYGVKISISYYGMIEQGVRSPSLKLAIAIADLYEVRPEDIFLDNKTTKCCSG